MEVLSGVERTTPRPVETGADRLPCGGIGKEVAVESGLEGLGIGSGGPCGERSQEETLDSGTEGGGWGRGRRGEEAGLGSQVIMG